MRMSVIGRVVGTAVLLLGTFAAEAEGGGPANQPLGASSLMSHIKRVTASSTMPDWKKYSFRPRQLLDGRLETSWQPQSKRGGLGEFVEFEFDQDVQVSAMVLANGFQLNDDLGDLFVFNNRAKKVRLSFSSGAPLELELDGNDRKEIVSSFPERVTRKVKVEILEVVQGVRFHDLALSEVAFVGTPREAPLASPGLLECSDEDCSALTGPPGGPWLPAPPIPVGKGTSKQRFLLAATKLRAAPMVNAEVLARLPARDPVSIIATSQDTTTIDGKVGSWVQVEWSAHAIPFSCSCATDEPRTIGWVFGPLLADARPRVLQLGALAGTWSDASDKLVLGDDGSLLISAPWGGRGDWRYDPTSRELFLTKHDVRCQDRYCPPTDFTYRVKVLSADARLLELGGDVQGVFWRCPNEGARR